MKTHLCAKGSEKDKTISDKSIGAKKATPLEAK
jgi:hypothetical protein